MRGMRGQQAADGSERPGEASVGHWLCPPGQHVHVPPKCVPHARRYAIDVVWIFRALLWRPQGLVLRVVLHIAHACQRKYLLTGAARVGWWAREPELTGTTLASLEIMGVLTPADSRLPTSGAARTAMAVLVLGRCFAAWCPTNSEPNEAGSAARTPETVGGGKGGAAPSAALPADAHTCSRPAAGCGIYDPRSASAVSPDALPSRHGARGAVRACKGAPPRLQDGLWQRSALLPPKRRTRRRLPRDDGKRGARRAHAHTHARTHARTHTLARPPACPPARTHARPPATLARTEDEPPPSSASSS